MTAKGNVEFPYRRFRPGQREAIDSMIESIASVGAIALSAPTGFGKTITVLYALRTLKVDRIIYAVRTRNEIYPPMREAYKLGYRAIFFTSKKKLCPLAHASSSLSIDDFWENCRVLRRTGECDYYKAASEAPQEALWGLVSARPRAPTSTVRTLWNAGVCPYYAFKRLADSADLIVVTYPYVFSPVIREHTFERIRLEDVVLVVDEAHSLIGLADMAERRLSRRKVEQAIREIEEYTPTMLDYVERLQALLQLWDSLPSGRGYRAVDKRIVTEALGDPQEWYDLSYDIRARKIMRSDDSQGKARVVVHTLSIAVFLQLLEAEEYQLFTTMRRGEKVLAAKSVDPAIIASPPLSSAGALVLTSGTLPPVDFFRDVLGVSREIREVDVELEYGPVFPEENRATVVLTYVTSRYTRRSDEIYRKYARILSDMSRILPDTKLAVYPSYDFMREVLARVEETEGFVVEDEETRIGEVEEFVLKRRNVVINAVAGGKLCEGVEIVDPSIGASLIKTVVVMGIPYPQPDDYLEMLLQRLSERIGRERAWDHMFRDTAAVKTRQALGRAIRSEHDRAFFVLCDNRFMDPKIRSRIKIPYRLVVTSHDKYLEVLRNVAEYL